jgi:hypothetical protein
VRRSYEHVVDAAEDNKNATAAARLAAQDQWRRERGGAEAEEKQS